MATLASYAGSGTNWDLPSSGSFTWTKVGESFTTVAAGDAVTITMMLKRTGSPGTLTVNVYAASGDLPTGDSLASGTYDTSTIGTGAFEEVDVTITSVSLSNATKYVFTAEVSTGVAGSAYLEWQAKDTFGDAYSGGEGIKYNSGWATIRTAPSSTAFYFSIDTASHAKASNPDPANAATEEDWSDYTLDWSGTGDTYDVYGGAAGNFIQVASGISDTTYTLDSNELLSFIGGVVSWRVDSTQGEETLTGDTWTFDPRPGKASNPTPSDSGSDISIEQDLSWDAGANASTYDVVFEGSEISSAQADTSYTLSTDLFSWDSSLTWRVDSTNEFGTTTGDEWTFDSIALDHLRVTYTLIDGGSGNGPYDGGVEGTDYWFNGLNNVITVKRLICFGRDRAFVEDIN